MKPSQWELWHQQMSSPTVTAICQMLRPAFVRIGGTASATITYDMSSGDAAPTSAPSSHPKPAGHGGYSPQQPYRLPAAHWSAVCSWTAKVGWPIVFGLNLLSNRTGGPNGTEHWVADNAISLIRYTTKRHPGAVAGWELGNEPEGWKRNFGFSLSNSEIAADFALLRSLLRSEFFESQYLVVGPDQGIQGCLHSGSCDQYEELVALLRQHDSIDVSTFHFYNLGKTVNPQAEAALFTDPATFDLTKRATMLAVNATRGASLATPSSPAFPVWLGETATASGGGLAGSSGTYTATLLMVDKLGSVGRWGGTGLMRQSLFGGQYALLDPATYRPRPTFFVAAIFTQLVGTQVLAVDGDGASNRTLRVYARCADVDRYGVGAAVVFGGKHLQHFSMPLSSYLPGHVFVHLAVIIIRCTGAAVNLGPTTRLEFNAALTAAQSREDFILTGIAGTESLSVNGKNVAVPSPPSAGFEGQNTSSSSQLLLPSLSSFFSVFRGAGGPACMSK